jgi:hypothetical protein
MRRLRVRMSSPGPGRLWRASQSFSCKTQADRLYPQLRETGSFSIFCVLTEGAVYAEQARSLYIQNRKEALQAYWAGNEQRWAIDAQGFPCRSVRAFAAFL